MGNKKGKTVVMGHYGRIYEWIDKYGLGVHISEGRGMEEKTCYVAFDSVPAVEAAIGDTVDMEAYGLELM